jgi:hypothetical protein
LVSRQDKQVRITVIVALVSMCDNLMMSLRKSTPSVIPLIVYFSLCKKILAMPASVREADMQLEICREFCACRTCCPT